MNNESIKPMLLPGYIETERLVIRESTMDECEKLQELNEASDYIEKWVSWKTPKDYAVRAITEGNLPPGGKRELFSARTILLRASGQMIGTIELYHGYPCKDALCIGWLFIHPDYQKHGYARKVMDAIEGAAVKAGYARLRLGVHLKNWPALRSWLRLGFDKLVNITGDEIHDEKADATMILEKSLLCVSIKNHEGEYQMKEMIVNNEKVRIRKAVKSDAKALIEYLDTIGGESDFLTFGTGQFGRSVEQEEDFIENCLKKENALFIVAEINGKIIGNLNFSGGPRQRIAHTGEFGVSILKEYWGNGIGEELIKCLIDWSKVSGIIRKINLRVRTDNTRGIHLYKKLGFVEEGVIKRDFLIDGVFYDSLSMGLLID